MRLYLFVRFACLRVSVCLRISALSAFAFVCTVWAFVSVFVIINLHGYVQSLGYLHVCAGTNRFSHSDARAAPRDRASRPVAGVHAYYRDVYSFKMFVVSLRRAQMIVVR